MTTKLIRLVFLLGLLWGTGCSQRSDTPCVCEATPVVDTALMAFLSKAKAAHHQADLLEQSGQVDAAIEVLDKVTSFTQMSDRAEVREVLADTLARLSDLRGQRGQWEESEADIRKGLELAPSGSYFEGHLYEMRGVNEERRAKAQAEQGDAEGAQTARRRAIEAFERAIQIQDSVIRRELSDEGADR